MGIIKESQREQKISITGGLVSRVNFDSFSGSVPNVFQVRNYGTDIVYVGKYSTVTNTSDFLMAIVPNGVNTLTNPNGYNELYLYSASDASVIVNSFLSDEILSNDLYQTMSTVVINTTTTSNVDIVSALPAGTNEIGKVEVSNTDSNSIPMKPVDASGTPLFTPTNPGEVNATVSVNVESVTVDFPSVPHIYNVSMTNANTEYNQAIDANAKKIVLSVIDGDSTFNYRLAFETGKVATPTAPYKKYKGNVEYDPGVLKMGATPGSVYFACSEAGHTMQIEIWT